MALGRPLRAAAFVFAVVICATSGCGLPDARPNLPPPLEPDSSDTFKRFHFAVPSSTAAPFLGVEVYYRFFDVNVAGDGRLESHDELTQRGFIRFARHDDRPTDVKRPLIDRPAAQAEVIVQFNTVAGGAEPVASFPNRDGVRQSVAMRRGVQDDARVRFKRFQCTEFAQNDSDVPDEVEDELSGDCRNRVQIQAYALSYGRTAEGFTVYSDATFLGAITIAFGP